MERVLETTDAPPSLSESLFAWLLVSFFMWRVTHDGVGKASFLPSPEAVRLAEALPVPKAEESGPLPTPEAEQKDAGFPLPTPSADEESPLPLPML